MTLSPKSGIIRGEEVSGFVFLGQDGSIRTEKENAQNNEEQKNLKVLEEFWFQKGARSGEEIGYKKGWKEGDTKGYLRGLEEGKKQGLEEGKKQGVEEGKNYQNEEKEARLDDSIALLLKLREDFKKHYDKLFDQLKPELVELCLQICNKILSVELENKQNMIQVIESVLKKARPIFGEGDVQLSFSEEDFEALEPYLGKLKGQHPQVKALNFQADDTLKKGDVRLETPLGIMQFDLDRQIEDLRENLLR